MAFLTAGAVRSPRLCLLAALMLCCICLGYAYQSLGLNTDENDLFAPRLDFIERRTDFYTALPVLADPIVVSLERISTGSAATPDPDAVARQLAKKISEHPT
ncbi:MAG: hypothetical protein K0U93_02135, partial [Gammaproteobacteria bacterium]|nr:hypothetical protein [Gammaproteobacteria bacterium]